MQHHAASHATKPATLFPSFLPVPFSDVNELKLTLVGYRFLLPFAIYSIPLLNVQFLYTEAHVSQCHDTYVRDFVLYACYMLLL
jgi:hypothetical protein